MPPDVFEVVQMQVLKIGWGGADDSSTLATVEGGATPATRLCCQAAFGVKAWRESEKTAFREFRYESRPAKAGSCTMGWVTCADAAPGRFVRPVRCPPEILQARVQP